MCNKNFGLGYVTSSIRASPASFWCTMETIFISGRQADIQHNKQQKRDTGTHLGSWKKHRSSQATSPSPRIASARTADKRTRTVLGKPTSSAHTGEPHSRVGDVGEGRFRIAGATGAAITVDMLPMLQLSEPIESEFGPEQTVACDAVRASSSSRRPHANVHERIRMGSSPPELPAIAGAIH